MRKKITEESERGITVIRSKVKITEYPNNIFSDGYFNPFCPSGYNFLTGYIECKIDMRYQDRNVKPSRSMAGRVNGKPVHNFS